MTALTDEQTVQAILTILRDKDDADLTAFTLTGDGGVRDFTKSLTAEITGDYDETAVETDWTNEELATFALPIMRDLYLNAWKRGRKRLEVSSAVAAAQTTIDALDLGDNETPPT